MLDLLTWLWVWDIHFPELFLPIYFFIPKHTAYRVSKVWILPIITSMMFISWALFTQMNFDKPFSYDNKTC